MSLPFSQHHGLVQHEGRKEPMPLSEVLNGTTFVSAAGSVYRLFGNEDEPFSLPAIPPLPPILAASKAPAPSLEEILQQMGSFAAPATEQAKNEKVPEQPPRTVPCIFPVADSPTLQLFQTVEESAVPRLVRRESMPPRVTLSAKDIAEEVSQISLKQAPKPKNEPRKPLRVIPSPVEEPFIVPFTKPITTPETSSEKTETKNPVFKIVTEWTPPIRLPKTLLRRYWRRCRKEQPIYRKRLKNALFYKTSETQFLDCEKKLATQPPSLYAHSKNCGSAFRTFRWSAQLDTLTQTAGNQIRMLADHLVVQSNQGVKAICFKNVFPGDGCSTLLLCAARALTERKYRILLVDVHPRHIDLPKQLNVSGNSDSGTEVIELNDRLGLWVWQESKTTEENRANLAKIITACREEYDMILLDGGSVTESPLMEFVEFWNRVALDGVILVSNARHLAEIPLSHIVERLRQHHIHLVGIMENYV